MEIRQGDQVEIMTGKRQGKLAKVMELIDPDRVCVQIVGTPYDISYLQTDVLVRIKASKINPLIEDGTIACTPLQVTGDKKLRLIEYLIKTGKLCPSWPYACTGTCGATGLKHE